MSGHVVERRQLRQARVQHVAQRRGRIAESGVPAALPDESRAVRCDESASGAGVHRLPLAAPRAGSPSRPVRCPAVVRTCDTDSMASSAAVVERVLRRRVSNDGRDLLGAEAAGELVEPAEVRPEVTADPFARERVRGHARFRDQAAQVFGARDDFLAEPGLDAPRRRGTAPDEVRTFVGVEQLLDPDDGCFALRPLRDGRVGRGAGEPVDFRGRALELARGRAAPTTRAGTPTAAAASSSASVSRSTASGASSRNVRSTASATSPSGGWSATPAMPRRLRSRFTMSFTIARVARIGQEILQVAPRSRMPATR